jgi:hypothetical protein
MDVTIEDEIRYMKEKRQNLDGQIAGLKMWGPTRERAIAITKLQEAVMWLGMDLKRIGEANPGFVKDPYPNSKDPSTARIDPTADGLKL